ncbi:MAG: GGDEF domain-containing protein, partial [Acetobacteraceae bacterium]|nr:GGDEF domain-containing protein [Acetobacteraceae bacterium]
MHSTPSKPTQVSLPILLALLAALLTAGAMLVTRDAVDRLLRRDAEIAAAAWAEDLRRRLPLAPADWRVTVQSAAPGTGILGVTTADPAAEAPLPPPRPGKAIVPLRVGDAVLVHAVVEVDQAGRWPLYRHALVLGGAGLTAALLPGALAIAVVAWRHSRRRSEAEARLRHAAQHDPLTGLPNRQHLQDRLSAALAAAQREDTGLAVMVVDLDRFSEVNEGFGPAIGDGMLRETAARLLAGVRWNDIVARVGADTFVVVLTGLSAPAGATRLAERLAVALRQPNVIEDQVVPGGATIGIAFAPRD